MAITRGPQFKAASITSTIFTAPLFQVLSRTTGIDLLTASTTSILTTTFEPTFIHGVVVRIAASSGVSADAAVSIGINPSTTNLFNAQTMVNVQNVNDTYVFWSDRSTTLVASIADVIDLTVTSAGTGTTLTAEAFVIGTPI